jgi:FkbM family methyltransferase
MLGGRPPSFVIRQALARENYLALARMCRTCARPIDFARRYFLSGGDYPAELALRTPTGTVSPTVYSHHDVWTVNEVFLRLDYALPPDARIVVDVGSNIGISALYFLTRSPDVRCYLYEPDPRNAERLHRNLRNYETRYELACEAVADTSGTVAFGREGTGRYGGIGLTYAETLEVPCRHVNDVLANVLAREGHVDLLKIDTEGIENRTVAAIDDDLLAHVRVLCFETLDPFNPAPERFGMSFAADTVRLTNRALGRRGAAVDAEHGLERALER